jgi:peroxiredoxin
MRKSRTGVTVLFLVALFSIITRTMSAAPLKVGDKAPDFALPNQDGDTVKLSDYLGKKTVVLVFFAAACSDQSTSVIKPYQDRFAQFKQANAEVVGITVENVYLVEAFATELQTPFPLLSDYEIHFDKDISRAYGVIEGGARFASPFTIVIDKNGTIRHVEKGADPDQILQICHGL